MQAPTVTNFTASDPSPTNATTVHYTLTFSEPVTGVDSSQFSLVTAGVTGASIASVVPVSGSQYTVTINTGTGDGTIALKLIGGAVHDILGNPLPGGSFQPAPSLLTGSSPLAITTADANGDGKVDLFVTNANSSTVSVLLGNGDGSFQPQQTYATNGPGPVGIATADVNGDGKADLLVTNNSFNTVSVLLGNGDGTFQAQQTYATGISPQGITTADVNGDGKVDLLVANAFDNTVGVLLGNGDGTFQVQQAYRTGGTSPGTARITTADVNRDGKVDMLVTEVNTNIVSVLLGNGDGTFQAPQTYATGPGPQGVTTADVNGDGNVDLMVANWRSNNVSVLLGNGDGTFQAQQTYATGNNPFGITTADVNGARPTWWSPTKGPTPCRCCWAMAMAPSRPSRPMPPARAHSASPLPT
jgi:FG-GAP-like repeat/Dockerin type I domain